MDVGETRVRLLAVSWLIVALAGCQRNPKAVAPDIRSESPELPPVSLPASASREHLPTLAHANNKFALALYHRVRDQPGNLLVSPAGLSVGLALIRSGARGETADQIARVMHLPGGLAPGEPPYAAMIRDLNADDENRSYRVRLANALWVQDGYPLLDSYRSHLKQSFALDDHRVDFADHRGEACRAINDWIRAHTAGRIPGMLRPEELPGPTRLVLTNALYLKASWRERFERKSTRQGDFHAAPGRTVEVPMMNDRSYSGVNGYLDGGSFQVLERPCGIGGEFAMEVLLPRGGDGLAELESALTTEALDGWRSRFRQPEEIVIALPRFRIRADLELGPVLSGLGMPLAFDGARADFSGINGKKSDLFIASARSASVLDVNEEGIEAASGLNVLIPDAFGEETPVFRADHPFVFLVRDRRSGCILLLGRLVDPSESTSEAAQSAKE